MNDVATFRNVLPIKIILSVHLGKSNRLQAQSLAIFEDLIALLRFDFLIEINAISKPDKKVVNNNKFSNIIVLANQSTSQNN